MGGGAIFGLIVVTFFAMVFGLGYLRNRESMAMIERGMDPRRYRPQAAPYQTLKWGLLLLGAGIGLFLAYIFDHTAFVEYRSSNEPLYISLVAVFGGLGLFISYLAEKKEHVVQKQAVAEEIA